MTYLPSSRLRLSICFRKFGHSDSQSEICEVYIHVYLDQSNSNFIRTPTICYITSTQLNCKGIRVILDNIRITAQEITAANINRILQS